MRTARRLGTEVEESAQRPIGVSVASAKDKPIIGSGLRLGVLDLETLRSTSFLDGVMAQLEPHHPVEDVDIQQ